MKRPSIGLCGLVLAGCAGGGAPGTPAGGPTVTAGASRPSAAAVSATPDRLLCGRTPQYGSEVQGSGRGADVWGLVFAPVPVKAGREVKIVWRMTGEGPLRVSATLPGGTAAKLTWGPEEHGGSNWHRPGQEWGTGFVFPKRGCWEIRLTRDRGSGSVWLPVR